MNHNQIMLLDGHPPLNSIRVGPIPVVRLARAKNASVQSRIKQMTSQHKRTTKLCQSRASQTEWAEQHRVLWGQLFIWPLWVTSPGFELGALTQTVALLVPSRLLAQMVPGGQRPGVRVLSPPNFESWGGHSGPGPFRSNPGGMAG